MSDLTRPGVFLGLFLFITCQAPVVLADSGSTRYGAGARVGLGADVSGGIAYGIGLHYTRPANEHAVELGFMLFRGDSETTTDEGVHTYVEDTSLTVLAITANYLFGYGDPDSAVYLIAGTGAGGFNVDWSEVSATDPSLDIPLSSGGSRSEDDGSTGGAMFNLGIGRRVQERLDLRLEAPIFVVFSSVGESASVVPTLTATAALRF